MKNTKVVVVSCALATLAAVPAAGDSRLNANSGNATPLSTSPLQSGVDVTIGAVLLEIPIEAPPGRNDMAPELMLSYSSATSQNGIAGYGWSIPLGLVERLGTDQGVPRYDATDEFYLSDGGREKLLLVGGDAYRREIETDFSKIEFVNQSYWLVTKRNGTKHYYGRTSDSRVYDPSDASRVYRYLLDRIVDVHGNYLSVTYTQLAGEDKHPLEVEFTGYEPSGGGIGIDPYARVSFIYEAQSRPDTRFSYKSGFRIGLTQRLDRIDVLASGSLQRRYDLIYTVDEEVNKSYLTSIRRIGADGVSSEPDLTFEYSGFDVDFQPVINVPSTFAPPEAFSSGRVRAWDFNADGRDDLVYSPPGGGQWLLFESDGEGSFLPGQPVANSPPHEIGTAFGTGTTLVEDFSGDGFLDFLYYSGTSGDLWISDGEGGFYPPKQTFVPVDFNAAYIDMTRDGLVDFVYGDCTPVCNQWLIFENLGGGDFSPQAIMVANSPNFSVGGTSPGFTNLPVEYSDFNGDGLIDLARENEFWINNGTNGFEPPVIDPNLPVTFQQSSVLGLLFKVDVNGDGLVDFLDIISGPGVLYNRADGTFSTPLVDTDFTASHGIMFYDLNQDGFSDALVSFRDDFFPAGAWWVNLNDNGNGFLPAQPITNHPSWMHFNGDVVAPADVELVVADINGDSRLDVVYGGDPDYGGPLPVQYQVCLGETEDSTARSGILVAMNNGAGLRTEFTYAAQPVQGRTGASRGYAHESLRREAVVSKTESVALTGDQYVTTYDYEGGLWSEAEREFRGFKRVTETDPEGLTTVTEYFQNDKLKFKPFSVERFNESGDLLAKTLNTWNHQLLSPGLFVYLQEQFEFTYDGDLTGRATRETFTYGESPQLGNLTEHVEWGEVDPTTGGDLGTDSRSTSYSYGNNVNGSNYLVGFVQRIIQKDHEGGVTRRSWMHYDGASDFTSLPSRGNVTKRRYWSRDSENPERSFTYDAFGNILTTIDAEQSVTTVTYDPAWSLLPIVEENSLTHRLQFSYYGVNGEPLASGGYAGLFGQLKGVTDPNAATTSYCYDPLGRMTKTIRPLDSVQYPTVETSYTLVTAPGAEHWRQVVRLREEHGQPSTLDEYTFYDGLGRLIQRKRSMEAVGDFSVSDQATYNSKGSVIVRFAPFSSNTPPTSIDPIDISRPHVTHTYDSLNRPIRVVNADGSYKTTTYDDWSVTIIDENGHQKAIYDDAFGRAALVEEYTGADGRGAPTYPAEAFALYSSTTFENGYGYQVDSFTDTLSNTTTFIHDTLGRKTYATYPNAGAVDYTYNLAGEITSLLDAKGGVVEWDIDAIGRVEERAFPNSAVPPIDYVYDLPGVPNSTGRLGQVNVNAGQSKYFEYDPLGRVALASHTIDGQDYDIRMSYDALGRTRSQVYPDNSEVLFAYNRSGQVEAIVEASGLRRIRNVDYDAHGRITDILFGNRVHTSYDYNVTTHHLERVVTQKGSTVLQDLTYGYDKAGNVISVSNGVSGIDEAFVYDELNRLVSATGPYCDGSVCTKTYVYDEIGNLKQKDGLIYQYGENGNGPHAVTSLSDGTTMSYDDNGNMTSYTGPAGDFDFTYDREDRLATVTKDGALVGTYEYDESGIRAKATTYAGLISETTHFVGSLFEQGIESGLSARHIYLGTLRIASVASDGTTRYVHADHLGGTNVTTDPTGAERERIRYAPFGEVTHRAVSGGGAEDPYFQFTGHRFDEESDLLYMQARYYSPRLGRFLTPDNVIPDPLNPQSYNRYSYVYNNPIRLTDPSGNSPQDLKEIETVEVYPPPPGWIPVGPASKVVHTEEDGVCPGCGRENLHVHVTPPDASGLRHGVPSQRHVAPDSLEGLLANLSKNPVIGLVVPDPWVAADNLNTLTAPGSSPYERVLSAADLGLNLIPIGATRGTSWFGKHVIRKFPKRGWTKKLVELTVEKPAMTVKTIDHRRIKGGGVMNDPATRYYSPHGGYVVRNDRTKEIIQVSDRTDPNWKE